MQETGTMHLTVAGKNVQVTSALREHAERRTSKLLKYFDQDRPIRADVVLATERERHIAEITVQVGSLLVRGVGKTDDMYVSIDAAVERIGRQVRKYKTRIHRRLQEPAKTAKGADDKSRAADVRAADGQAGGEPQVVRVKHFAFKPMTVDEAILQMELLGHDFFVFTDGTTDHVNVLYRRSDGNYGLIEPEV